MNFESSSIFSWYPVDSLPGKSLKSIVELAKKGKLGENGTNRLPSILCGDYTTPLEERNLQNYTLICDALHNTSGVEKHMYQLFKNEPGFDIQKSEAAIKTLLGHQVDTNDMSGGINIFKM